MWQVPESSAGRRLRRKKSARIGGGMPMRASLTQILEGGGSCVYKSTTGMPHKTLQGSNEKTLAGQNRCTLAMPLSSSAQTGTIAVLRRLHHAQINCAEEFDMMKSGRTLFLAGLAALSLAACSTTGERVGGAGVGALAGGAVAGPVGAVVGGVAGAITGPAVASNLGVPHRRSHRYWRHHRRG